MVLIVNSQCITVGPTPKLLQNLAKLGSYQTESGHAVKRSAFAFCVRACNCSRTPLLNGRRGPTSVTMIFDDSSSSEDELLILWSLSASRRKRKHWVRPVNKDRERDGEFHRLFSKWINDEEIFYNSFRMSIDSFNELYDKIKHDLVKQDTNWRKAIISAKESHVLT